MSPTNFPRDNRFGAMAAVSRFELETTRLPPGELLRRCMEGAVEEGLRKILADCVTTSGIEETNEVIIRLDCYVFSPDELATLLAQARRDGERDAMRWRSPFDMTRP